MDTFILDATGFANAVNPSIAELVLDGWVFWRSSWFCRLAAPIMPDMPNTTSSLY
jgi:hypothetical protein